MVVDVLDAAVLLDQLPGALGADARHPGDAVGGVPLDGLDVDELAGGDAVVLPDLRFVVQGDLGLAELGGGQAHRGLVRDQLQAVPVPCGDDALGPFPLALGGEGAQDVVGLPALAGHHLVAHVPEQVLKHRQLDRQFLGHALAVCLVPGVGLVPEGGALPVEGHRHPVGGGLLQQLVEHGEETVNAVCKLPVFGGEDLDAVEGPV